jgi:restriction endonuclease S subunit
MSVWPETTLKEKVFIKHGFAFKGEYFVPEGKYMLLTPGNFNESGGFRVREGKEKYYAGEIPSSYILNKNDLIVAMTEQGEGLLGSAAIIPKSDMYLHNQRLGLITVNEEEVHKVFLYYLLNTSIVRQQIRNSSSGTKVRHTSPERIYRVSVRLPEIETQKKIAAILSAYDDLIENNKRRIALLENMAEEIYREWFVRFRFPNYKNVEFEKGMPKGWVVKTFRDITTYYIGGGWGEEVESPTFTEGAYVIRGTDIPPLANGNYSNKVYRYHKPSNLQTRKLQKNDFVFEVSGGSTDQLLGRNLMVTEGLLSLFEDKVMCASFCKLIRFDKNQVSPFFMKYYLKLYYECDLVGIYQVQSTGISNYQFESFLNYQTLPIPNRVLLDEFDKLVMPIIKQQELLALSNAQLERTKNSLLPRLISGKLTVENLNIQFPPSMVEAEIPPNLPF